MVLRGSEDQASKHFHNAMRQYMRRDYASAIPGLRGAVHLNPQAANANFYLGACYLLNHQTDLAILSLEKVVSDHDPNYAEQAHFYLAKAYIRKGDFAAAKSELERTVQLHGDREQEARKLETQLTQLIPKAR
jgi:TolA-binding protein